MEFIYKGLSAKLEKHIVTDQELQEGLDILRQNNRKETAVERPAQMGDELIFDYAGFCDGEQFQGGTAEYQMLKLGSGRFIPGFEEQLVGAKPGEDVTVNVTFPAEYHAPELAGKQAQFKCKIHQVRESTLYDLDDTFAHEVGHCENMEIMTQQVRERLQQFADERSEMDLQNELLRQAIDSYEMDEPTTEELEAAIDEQIAALESHLSREGGVDLQEYCKIVNTTVEKLREQAIPAAKKNIRANAAISQIIRLEKLEATQEELDQAMELVAQQNMMTLADMKPYITEEFTESVKRTVLTGKVMELIRMNAHIE